MKDLIKVRIDKSDHITWYAKEFIGEELCVTDEGRVWRFSPTKTIWKDDCTVIQDNTEKEEKDTYQPDEWVVWSGNDPVVAQIKKRVDDDYWNKECYELKTSNEHTSCSVKYLRPALPHEIPAPEPLGYCIKRTPENAEVLNKWYFKLDGNVSLQHGYMYSIDISEYKKYYKICKFWDEEKFEGFTELFTTEEFFKKVGYMPEPVLIAKAGEWVKIVDFGDADNCDGEFSFNKPYELREDLFKGGPFRPKEDDKGSISNGYSKYPAETMKFEKVPSPKEYKHLTQTVNNPNGVVVLNSEVKECIERPIDKVTIERLELVLKMCNIQLSTVLVDKIIDCVELIEEKGEGVNLMDVCKMQAQWK